MSDKQQRPDARRLWQSQVGENSSMSVEDLRGRVSKMNRLILLRTLVSGLAFLIFIGLFAETATWKASSLVNQTDIEIMQCVFLIGAGCGLWRLISLLRRERGKSLTEGEPNACAAFYRSELERQSNSYRRSAIWLPLAFSTLWAWGVLVIQPLRVIMVVIWILFIPFWVYRHVELANTSRRELDKLNASSGRSFS